MSNNILDVSYQETFEDRREPQLMLHQSMRDISALQFEEALASIGQLAYQADRIVESTGAALATMSAQGDRIDWLQAHNRAAIAALNRRRLHPKPSRRIGCLLHGRRFRSSLPMWST